MNRCNYLKTDCWLAIVKGDRMPILRQEFRGRFVIGGHWVDRTGMMLNGFTVKTVCRVGTRPRGYAGPE